VLVIMLLLFVALVKNLPNEKDNRICQQFIIGSPILRPEQQY
jgi:hypothetical protein